MKGNWYEIDRKGLAKLIERKGKQFVLFELVQNAWDENVTAVEIVLERTTVRYATLTVRDDNPEGFADLTHAYTLFAESKKKGDAEKRGRFNLGEKLVLALCEEAQVITTKGSVIFDAEGRHSGRTQRESGTEFSATLKLTNAEFAEFERAATTLLPPPGVKVTFNGAEIEHRHPLANLPATLPTVLSDEEGVLRPTSRATMVHVVEPFAGETPTIYEMGIPVVEHDGKWHLDVQQKVPLNMDRDNVTPAYLGKLRAVVTEYMSSSLTAEDANSAWVADAIERHGEDLSDETINRWADLRYGEKRVAYDPSDKEANALATASGYTVVHGGSLSRAGWEAVKRVGAILPAGQVTPSPKPFSADGRPLKMQDPEKMTQGMHWFQAYAKRIGKALLGVSVQVTLVNDVAWRFNGTYGKGELHANVGSLGKAWFDRANLARINDFLIHEYAHHFESNHLSENYYHALSRLGGELSVLALDRPELFGADASREAA